MDIVAELKKWGCELEPFGNKVKLSCPIPGHVDANPSCEVLLEADDKYEAGSYFCPVCRLGGDFYDLLGKITGTPGEVFKKQFTGKYRKIGVKKIDAYYAQLLVSGHKTAAGNVMRRELEIRGISEETMKKYSLGYDSEGKSLMLPVRWGDRFINVMRYKPGGKPKFANYAKGYGRTPVLYPQDQLKYKKIVVCGGPVKALVVAQYMNKHGIGAVSTCFGETPTPIDLVPWLYGKKVWVCFDIDTHGIRNSDMCCGVLQSRVEWVGNIFLPISEHLYPKGDVNDYFGPEEHTSEEFLDLLNSIEQWEDTSYQCNFSDDYDEVKIGKLSGYTRSYNFSTSAYLSGVDDSTAHKLPKKLAVSCSGDADVCGLCQLTRSPSYTPDAGIEVDVEPRNPLVMGFVGVTHKVRDQAFKEYFGIPEPCHKCVFQPSEELYTVRYILLSDIDTDSETPTTAVIITDGGNLHCGEVCHIKGRADQSPLNSEELRVITEHEPKDVLSEYHVDNIEELEVFRPKDNSYEALEKKLEDISFDLERNVTFIYGRSQVHLLFDLAFHSPLWVPFENDIEPGWVSVLLVSETAQGKSTIMRRLIKHYGYGAYIDAANTTIAGLVGGIKSVAKRQFVKWGIIPQNDKRLVCIEEYANAPVELLRAMRAARDSGVVSMNKIDKGRANARTRTIVLSNPKKLIKPGVVIDGIGLMEDLVERPEDLRRFDVGMWIPKIDMEEWHDSSEPQFSSNVCHQLITWAWTVPPEKIIFTGAAVTTIRENTMKKEYPFLHLVGMREFDVKLTRLAAAVACRTFNVVDGNLIVEERHVHWVCKFLRSLYDDPEFGYSSRIRREEYMDDACTIDQLLDIVNQAGNAALLCEYLERYNRYPVDDFRASVGDSFTFDTIKNKLLILGCIVGEDDAKWNNAYLPTIRLKKHLPKVRETILKRYSKPKHLRGQTL